MAYVLSLPTGEELLEIPEDKLHVVRKGDGVFCAEGLADVVKIGGHKGVSERGVLLRFADRHEAVIRVVQRDARKLLLARRVFVSAAVDMDAV